MAFEENTMVVPPIFATEAATDLMVGLLREKKSAREFQMRRHLEWGETYELYRNKIRTNRLTQRQTVNIPLMKETIKTLLARIDDPPHVEWRDLGGDEQKQIIFQEIWNYDYDRLNLEGVDLQDKKTVMLYGRSFKKLNWIDGKFEVRPLDIFDVVVDPFTSPLDIETARFVIHQNIFRSLREVLADDRYDDKAKEKLKSWLVSKYGMVQTAKNKEEWERKMARLRAMGVQNTQFYNWAAGDILVNLTEHYRNEWSKSEQKFIRKVVVYADDVTPLLDEKLEDLMGIDFWPFVTWADDVESQDFWSDGIGDLIRVPNKMANIWFSQLVENRTLKNFQMHWYDATIQGYSPQTYEPGAGRMLPAPGDPNKTILPVNIDGLDDTLTAIDYVTKVVERASAATATAKGENDEKEITLGQVKMMEGAANERVLSMAKFYRRAWEEYAKKYEAIISANAKGKMTLHKTSQDGKLWPKAIYVSDWKSKEGYRALVRSTSEQEGEKSKGIQRFLFVQQQFPQNKALAKIAQKRELELLDLTPSEMREVKEEEDKIQIQQMGQEGQPGQPGGQPGQGTPGTSPIGQGMQPAPPPQGVGAPQQPNPDLVKGLQDRLASMTQHG